MKRTRFTLSALAATALLLSLAGCTETNSTDSSTTSSSAASLPQTLFASASPSGATGVADAKAAAKQGDRVVFEGRVGGRKDPFIANRAVFYVADASLLSCAEMEEDHCPTPWDYCCEPPDNLLAHLATVQVVDDAGQPLKVSLEKQGGLEPLKTVVIVGTVDQTDESGAFVVNAESIFVKEG